MKIFFDVDGVLIDGWHARSELRKPWDATIEADLGVDRVAFQRLLFHSDDGRSASLIAACAAGRCDLKDALAYVLPRAGYKGSVDDFMRYWFEKDSNINSDLFDLVAALRAQPSIELFIATRQEHHRARYLWDELGFSKYFNEIFYSAKIGHLKNDLRFFEAINRTLSIEAGERPLFFDDQAEIVDLAAQAGWDGTAFTAAGDVRDHPRLRHLWR